MRTKRLLIVAFSGMFFVSSAFAQTTAFNFQGRLNNGTSAANGNYDFQFELYDAITGGNQIGTTVERLNLPLVNGVFSTTLDFGAAAFVGGNRFLEVSVRPAGSPNAFVVLGARQQILSVPLAVRAANATLADNSTNAQNAVNATNAQTAVNATNSQTAVNATNAVTSQNSLSLGGVAASNYARLNFINNGGFEISGDLVVQGNIRQFNASNGGTKAVLYVRPSITGNPTFVRCYNGIINSSTPPCGFNVISAGAGIYRIDFGFDISSRIATVSAEYASGCAIVPPACGGHGRNFAANFRQFNSTSIEVFTFDSGNSDDTRNAAFTLVLH